MERRPVARPAETRLADGVGLLGAGNRMRFDIIWRYVARVVTVSGPDEKLRWLMRILVRRHPHVVEGAGAAALAAVIQERRH